MIDIILFQPEIPKTRKYRRAVCFYRGSVTPYPPLGFKITDKNLRRAGMDYWKDLEVLEYENWDRFLSSSSRPDNIFSSPLMLKKNLGCRVPKKEMGFSLVMKEGCSRLCSQVGRRQSSYHPQILSQTEIPELGSFCRYFCIRSDSANFGLWLIQLVRK